MFRKKCNCSRESVRRHQSALIFPICTFSVNDFKVEQKEEHFKNQFCFYMDIEILKTSSNPDEKLSIFCLS